MTVKVIGDSHPGKIDPYFETTCGRCGCFFGFNKSDAKFLDDQRDGPSLTISCPGSGCGARVVVDARKARR